MATRGAETNTNLSEVSWVSGAATEATKVDISYTAPLDHIFFASGATQRLSGGNSTPRLNVAPLSTVDGCELNTTADYSQMLATKRFNDSGSGPVTLTILNELIGSASGSLKEKHAHVLGLELRPGDGDKYAESLGTSTTTSSTFQQKLRLSFTPATAGDYLLIFGAQLKHASTSQSLECHLNIDKAGPATIRHLARMEPFSTAEWRPWGGTLGAITGETQGQFSAAAHTIDIEFRSLDGSTTASIREAYILALRLDTFANFYYQEALGPQLSRSNTYVTKLTNAPTIVNAGNHLIFSGAIVDGALGFATGVQFVKGITSPTTLLECIVQSQLALGLDEYVCGIQRMENLSAGASDANSWTYDLKRSVSPGAPAIQHAAICVIELAEAAAGQIVSLGPTVTRGKIVLAG